ncbi:MAG TPA: hypothetical protein VEL31_18380 [Ktedonobacteraceae bacterium]|nr:hypothetical protein [Ktedonobacteraceae bacterium]
MAATTCQATGFDEPQDDTMENTQSLHAPDPVQRPVVADEAHSTHRILAMSIWTLATEKLILAAFFRVLPTFFRVFWSGLSAVVIGSPPHEQRHARKTHRVVLVLFINSIFYEKLHKSSSFPCFSAFFRVLKTCSPRFSAFFPCLHSMTVVRDMTKPVREGPGLVSHLLVPPFPIVVILTICTSLYSTL